MKTITISMATVMRTLGARKGEVTLTGAVIITGERLADEARCNVHSAVRVQSTSNGWLLDGKPVKSDAVKTYTLANGCVVRPMQLECSARKVLERALRLLDKKLATNVRVAIDDVLQPQ